MVFARMDQVCVDSLVALAEAFASVLKSEHGRIILAGAGTSGRIAAACARLFNRALGRTAAHYLIAGGDEVLMRPKENVEDNTVVALTDIEAVVPPGAPVAYVGITCGLSAPYVAAQLDWLLRRAAGPDGLGVHAALLGFSPVDRARNAPIEGCAPFRSALLLGTDGRRRRQVDAHIPRGRRRAAGPRGRRAAALCRRQPGARCASGRLSWIRS
jgi:hypothetical protein